MKKISSLPHRRRQYMACTRMCVGARVLRITQIKIIRLRKFISKINSCQEITLHTILRKKFLMSQYFIVDG